MGAIGSGKTTLIARLAEKLKDDGGIAVFNGDATTSDDQNLVAGTGVQVVQLATVNGCHLDANLVGKALKKIELDGLRLLFLENIGNLICPAEFPLGANARVVVISVTEGPMECAQASAYVSRRADCGDQQNRSRCRNGSERGDARRRRSQAQTGYQGHPDQLQNRALA